ncbi:hypothetical protein A4X09_0g2374 [Tilletia walkeri]|uniref:Peptidase A1 domain-containing protein n=1 Tax=Tilletia walkeri TaxID=117179 RepID=A0A8X7NAZ9_9BASI|nr:hypothetical protein A4X09_0g2374 [Tilletia walkeri]
MLFSPQRWAALALFSLLSLNQLDNAAASAVDGAAGLHQPSLQHRAEHTRRHHAELQQQQQRQEAEERDRVAAMPVADKFKIQRFIKNVESRYARSNSVQADKWDPKVAKADGLDTTVADSDNQVQDDIISQLSAALKTGLDRIGEEFTKVVPGSKRGFKRLASSFGGEENAVTIPLRAIVLAEDQDAEYLAQVMVGTPPAPYWLQVDSGSSDPWVASIRCTTEPCRGVNGARARYNTSNSSTYQPTPSKKSFELYYSLGGVRGVMVRDTFSFSSGDLFNAALTIRNQTFGLARQLSSDFAKDAADGVLGLGFRALTVAGERTILQNLFAQNNIKNKIVSFYLGRKRSGTQDKSEMKIGGTNSALYKGDLRYVPVTKRAYWSFSFGKFGVSGTAKKNTVIGGPNGVEGVVDTGTSYIALPYGSASDFWNAVPGSQSVGAYNYWVYPCSTKLSVDFTLPDGTVFKLDPADLNAGKAYMGSSDCIGTVFSADTGNKAIFGASLLKSVYTVLDWGSSQIGFAQAA